MRNFLFLKGFLSNALGDSYIKKPLQYMVNKCYDRWRVFARGVINPSKMTLVTGSVRKIQTLHELKNS